MVRVIQFFQRLARKERAAEVTELAIVLALIVAGALVTILVLGPKVAQLFTTTNNALP